MNRVGVGLTCAVILGLVACASEEVDQAAFRGSGGRAGAGAVNGAAGRGGSSASNSAGSAGRPSQSGTAGSGAGASSNGTGGMGLVGAGGSGSSVGGAGVGGTTASAGGGGASPVFESGACASNPSLSLSYKQASTSPRQITALYQFSNTTDTPIPIAQLKIRYFFSDEETSGWSPAIYDAKVEGGTLGYRPLMGSTLTVSPLGTVVPGADSYIELSFASTTSLEKGATATVSWDLQPRNYSAPDQVQSNDYSYNAAAVAYTVWDHVVIYQSGSLVWGCTPKADGGTGGAGNGGAGNGGASNGGAGNGGTSGTVDGGTGGAVNGGNTSAGANTGGASAGVGGTAGVGAGGANNGGSSGAAVGGDSAGGGFSGGGAFGGGGGLNAVAGAGGSSSGGSGGAP